MSSKSLLLLLLSTLVLLCSLTSCTDSVTSSPRGSVIEKNSTWNSSKKMDQYTQLDIWARIQNVGSDGVIKVYCKCSPSSDDPSSSVSGSQIQSTEIYLKQAAEKTLHFYFWADGKCTWRVYFD